jgi:hypothetical protein
MGLLLSKGADKVLTNEEGQEYTVEGRSIYIQGTDIELTTIYARMQFTANPDGKTISVTFRTYASKEMFNLGKELHADIRLVPFEFSILDTEEQSLRVALDYSIDRFKELGYNAEII